MVFINGENETDQQMLLKRIKLFVDSKQPTRVLIVSPCFRHPEQLKRNLLEIATIPSGFLLTRPEEVGDRYVETKSPYTITLCLNRESMKIDPIEWEKFKEELMQWRDKMCPTLHIPPLTDGLFNERVP